MYQCKKCGKKFKTVQALGGHSAGHKAYSRHPKSPANSKGHLTLDAMRDHGAKYLSTRREVLLSEIDQIDAALKLMK